MARRSGIGDFGRNLINAGRDAWGPPATEPAGPMNVPTGRSRGSGPAPGLNPSAMNRIRESWGSQGTAPNAPGYDFTPSQPPPSEGPTPGTDLVLWQPPGGRQDTTPDGPGTDLVLWQPPGGRGDQPGPGTDLVRREPRVPAETPTGNGNNGAPPRWYRPNGNNRPWPPNNNGPGGGGAPGGPPPPPPPGGPPGGGGGGGGNNPPNGGGWANGWGGPLPPAVDFAQGINGQFRLRDMIGPEARYRLYQEFPEAALAWEGTKFAFRGTRTTKNPRSEENRRVMYGGVQREIKPTNYITVTKRPPNPQDYERSDSTQRSNDRNYYDHVMDAEANDMGGFGPGGPGGPPNPPGPPPGPMFGGNGRGWPATPMPAAGGGPDPLHAQKTGVAQGPLHNSVTGQTWWTDPHFRAASGLGRTLPDLNRPLGIRAPIQPQ